MKQILFKMARLKIMGTFVGFMFAYFPFLVPVKKIVQTKKAVSFLHPSPSYQNHILIVPRKVARNVFCLSDEDFLEALEIAAKIRNKDDRDFVLLINGGKRQDVMQAHFHLFTDNIAVQKKLPKTSGQTFMPSDKLFWKHIVSNLHDLLNQYKISEKSFSIVIQFEKNSEPSVYFV